MTEDAQARPFPVSMAWLLDNPLARAKDRLLLLRLGVGPGTRVLDYGCGPGRFTLAAAHFTGWSDRGTRLTGAGRRG